MEKPLPGRDGGTSPDTSPLTAAADTRQTEPTPPPEETAMNPSLSYYLATARVAELHHQAHRDTLAHSARQARRARRHQPAHPAPRFPAAGRRLLTLLSARST
jgi:hypothetical protein